MRRLIPPRKKEDSDLESNQVREKLKKYKEYKANIKVKDLKIEELEEEVGVSGQGYEERTGKTYKVNSFTENQAIDILEKKEQLSKERRYYEREIERIDNALNTLNEDEREIIISSLIEGRRYSSIEVKYNYTYSNIKKIERRAIKKIAKFMD